MALIGDLSGLGAAANAIGTISTAVSGVIQRVIPDPDLAKKLDNEVQIAVIGQGGELQKAIAEAAAKQADVNMAEAQSPSMFVSGWRPAVGWICAFGLAYAFLVQPLLTWVSSWFHASALPVLDTGTLMTVLTGMLGLAAARTTEKIQGVASQNMAAPAPSLLKRMFK